MFRSSIFSFNTLQLSVRGSVSTIATLAVAGLVVAAIEGAVRLDSTPKSLPFAQTRDGSLVDYTLRKRPQIDFLFLGSSQCQVGIVPRNFSQQWQKDSGQAIRGFNFGISGANILTVDAFYDDVLRDICARNVVIFVSPVGVSRAAAEQLVNNYGVDYITGKLSPVENCLMRLHLFRYRRQFRELRYQYYVMRHLSLEGDLERRVGPYLDGWVPKEGLFLAIDDDNAGVSPQVRTKVMSEMPNIVITSLQETIQLAQRRGMNPILAVLPHPPRFNLRMRDPEKTWSRFIEKISLVATKTHIQLIDHHSLAAFTDSDFWDSTHMNTEAAVRYSLFLADELKRERLLTSPRPVHSDSGTMESDRTGRGKRKTQRELRSGIIAY